MPEPEWVEKSGYEYANRTCPICGYLVYKKIEPDSKVLLKCGNTNSGCPYEDTE